VLKLSGIGESRAGEAVTDLMGPGRNPYVGILASPGEVRLFLTARAATDDEARRLLAPSEAAIRERLGKYVFGADSETHAAVALAAAATAGWTLATAEGFTGGAIASQLWEAGAANFRGGRVLGGAILRDLVPETGDPGAAAMRLAETAAREASATAGLAAALDSEFEPGASGQTAWVGLWAGPRSAARGVPLFFGADVDRQRVAHQAFYELRRLAATASPVPSP
jgi:nicotinamide-nucleotide amidase